MGEKLLILNILSVVLFAVVLVVSFWQLFKSLQLRKIAQTPDQTATFKMKFQLFQKIYQRRIVGRLVMTVLLLSLGLMVTSASLFLMTQNIEDLNKQLTSQKKTLENLKTAQEGLTSQIPVVSYPQAGIGLADYNWQDLFEEDQQEETREELEAALSEKLGSYFGATKVLISVETATKTLSLTIISETGSASEEEMLEKNTDLFVEELNQVPSLTQVQLELTVTEEEQTRTIFNGAYLRDSDSDTFKLYDTTSDDSQSDADSDTTEESSTSDSDSAEATQESNQEENSTTNSTTVSTEQSNTTVEGKG